LENFEINITGRIISRDIFSPWRRAQIKRLCSQFRLAKRKGTNFCTTSRDFRVSCPFYANFACRCMHCLQLPPVGEEVPMVWGRVISREIRGGNSPHLICDAGFTFMHDVSAESLGSGIPRRKRHSTPKAVRLFDDAEVGLKPSFLEVNEDARQATFAYESRPWTCLPMVCARMI
jgi:hypothetical protein